MSHKYNFFPFVSILTSPSAHNLSEGKQYQEMSSRRERTKTTVQDGSTDKVHQLQ